MYPDALIQSMLRMLEQFAGRIDGFQRCCLVRPGGSVWGRLQRN